ncbi:MAG: ABC transporter ATP-binding protein [Rhodospirillales bacterium]|nr:ABC transporter ATP-binding protein [Rhodospirillales bacterium]
MSEPALRLDNIRRQFTQGKEVLEVLSAASMAVRPGEIVALVGPSGSGKSTLLHIAGLLEHADSGDVIIAGESASRLSDDRRTLLRRQYLGFVYQYHHLLPEFSAVENIVLPQMIGGTSRRQAEKRALDLLGRMGLKARAQHRPGQLSGGEQQRVAIARALGNTPRLLLADEPTGNLDPHTADAVFEELLKQVRESGLAALIATHNPELAKRMDRRVTLQDGQITEMA